MQSYGGTVQIILKSPLFVKKREKSQFFYGLYDFTVLKFSYTDIISDIIAGTDSSAGIKYKRVRRRNMSNDKIHNPEVDHLLNGILQLQTLDEAYAFIEDVCTVNEILSLAQRFEVASMLRKKETYLEIAKLTGASTATISRVNRALNYGSDGYDLVLKRLGEE